MATRLTLGMLGLGTVGSAVARALVARAEEIQQRTGYRIELRHVAVKDRHRSRGVSLEGVQLHDDPVAVATAPDVDIVVEVMGGDTVARRSISAALESGKPVVTANKLVVSRYGPELMQLAVRRRVPFLFEAAVGGAIPIIRPIRESLASDRILTLIGILNGTTNYILTHMSDHGTPMEAAVAQAQQLGYAEANPELDLSGKDAAYKLAVLASLAFDAWVFPDAVLTRGLEGLSPRDLLYARELGFAVKLLAVGHEREGRVHAWVGPALVALRHPLAQVSGVNNAIVLLTEAAGELMFYGPGAGGDPTAAAVLGDVMDVARRFHPEVAAWVENGAESLMAARRAVIGDPDADRWRYYVRLEVADRPGVLAAIASVFGRLQVSIESVLQKGRGQEPVDLVFVTHEAPWGAFSESLQQVSRLPVVVRVGAPMRVVGV